MPIYTDVSETLERSGEASMEVFLIAIDEVIYLSELNHALSV